MLSDDVVYDEIFQQKNLFIGDLETEHREKKKK